MILVAWPALQRSDFHFPELDDAGGPLKADVAAQRVRLVGLGCFHAVHHHHDARASRGDLERVPFAAGARMVLYLRQMGDSAGRVLRIGATIEDVRFGASRVDDVVQIRAAHVDAGVGVVAHPELGT